ncbi:ExbD/TolR family protein [Sandaracinus amylolyticus]|uniref:Biopolymer transport protein ExbD/TolR n=1 Tax=Sandaracinus amylolyticus TaxID=927083 RepID=A0A0F6W2K3_9BACT|nr:biopolymer transporter ExbD [Sandaracinus amylolyticus]AKF05640.1 Biopolymer transport protein ExbD/TolR [Sandaracinus amylolyticus]
MAATTSSGGRGRRGGGMIVGINVTPMVDVVLVLLVIMMVSATYIVSQSMRVDLPNTATSDGSAASLAAVSIAADGALQFNGEPVDEAALIAGLRDARRRDPELTLIVSADRAAQHGAVVHVLDVARTERITSFAVQVERSE